MIAGGARGSREDRRKGTSTSVSKERFADLSQYEEVRNFYEITFELLEQAKGEMWDVYPHGVIGCCSWQSIETFGRRAFH